MRCVITATGKTIFRFREKLKEEIPDYDTQVSEEVPDAAVLGNVQCTAVFKLQTDYVDFQMLEHFYYATIRVYAKNYEYCKFAKSKKGTVQKLVPNIEIGTRELTMFNESDDDKQLGEFEDLEQWELRRAGKL